MAEDKKDNYPQMSVKWWWELRRKFKRSLPSAITDTYLGTVLNVKTSSVKSVAIPQLKLLGIINQDGTINDDRARAWRDDEEYAKVCQSIIQEIYPQELIDAFPDASENDSLSIKQWFSRKIGVGDSAAKSMTIFYLMLSEADLSKVPDTTKTIARSKQPASKPNSKPKNKDVKPKEQIIVEKEHGVETGEGLSIPSININVQVHIAADAEASQIDQIFSSMARHLNIKRKTSNE